MFFFQQEDFTFIRYDICGGYHLNVKLPTFHGMYFFMLHRAQVGCGDDDDASWKSPIFKRFSYWIGFLQKFIVRPKPSHMRMCLNIRIFAYHHKITVSFFSAIEQEIII